MQYRRARVQGGTYFFTVVACNRQHIFAVKDNVDVLRRAFQDVMETHPFRMDAHVILPDHLHCIWTLPAGDRDFSTRWRLIKSRFTRQYQHAVPGRSPWQKKFWEHVVRDAKDMGNHVDYIHYNPVKHGLVESPVEWALSSIHRYMNDGLYSRDWGASEPLSWDAGVGKE